MHWNKKSSVCLILWWSMQMHSLKSSCQSMNVEKRWITSLADTLFSSEHIDSLRLILRRLIKPGLSPVSLSTSSLCSSPTHYRRDPCVPHGRQCRCPRRPWWCSCWPPPPCCGCSRRRGLTPGTGCWSPAPRPLGTANIWNTSRTFISQVFSVLKYFSFKFDRWLTNQIVH